MNSERSRPNFPEAPRSRMNLDFLMARVGSAFILVSFAAGCAGPTATNETWLGQLIQTCTVNPFAPGLQDRRPRLDLAARIFGGFTTPFKYLGISGWTDLGLRAQVTGRVYQDSAWGTDGFTTIDVEIHELEILTGGSGCSYKRMSGDPAAYIRIEIKPWVKSPALAGVKAESLVRAAGRLKVDHDADFFEIHPEHETDILRLAGQ